MTGGGSGGHITPILSVAHALKSYDSKLKVVYIGQKGDHIAAITHDYAAIDSVYRIRAGKFRRYYGKNPLLQLFDLRTQFLNFRDLIYFLIGIAQAWKLLGKIRPSAIFVKGGFVSLPVALAARLKGIPYMTHDSDVTPGLANRVVARWADLHATGMPKERYPYPKHKTVYTGVPVDVLFVPITASAQAAAKHHLNIQASRPVVLVIGGGLGARRLNQAVVDGIKQLLEACPKLFIIHVVGSGNLTATKRLYRHQLGSSYNRCVMVLGFVQHVHLYSAAADLIVTRAGATALAEFASQSKPCIIVPNPFLTGGHQLKNAELLSKDRSAIVIQETMLKDKLAKTILSLIKDKALLQNLGKKMGQLAKRDSASQIARLLIEITNNKGVVGARSKE